MIVYIPTRKRTDVLAKAIPAWMAQKVRLVLVVEASEKAAYQAMLDSFWHVQAEILTLPRPSLGMGYIRDFILKDASKRGHEAFVISVDRIKPTSGDVRELAHVVLGESVVGCAAAQSYHGLALGNKLLKSKKKHVFPVAGGFHDLVAIHVGLAKVCGGFDRSLKTDMEDAELQRESIRKCMPWFYNTGVRYTGTVTRRSPGGMMAYVPGSAREAGRLRCHEIVHSRWPKYITKPPAAYRCQWRRMMADFIPDWTDEIPTAVKRLGYRG